MKLQWLKYKTFLLDSQSFQSLIKVTILKKRELNSPLNLVAVLWIELD